MDDRSMHDYDDDDEGDDCHDDEDYADHDEDDNVVEEVDMLLLVDKRQVVDRVEECGGGGAWDGKDVPFAALDDDEVSVEAGNDSK